MGASAILAVAWFALAAYGLAKFKKRGLWFLLGTPFIILWFVFFLVARACTNNVRNCP
jgi:energy-coupling factor transporter transmembrane protein EcfT